MSYLEDRGPEAFCCIKVYPEGKAPKRPGDVPKKFTVAPRWVNEAPNPWRHGLYREWAAEGCVAYNNPAIAHGWKTWAILCVCAADWRHELAKCHFLTWVEANEKHHSAANYHTYARWYVTDDPNAEMSCSSGSDPSFKVPAKASTFDILAGCIDSKLESIAILRRAMKGYRAYLKKNPVDYTFPKGVPVLEELMARQHDNTPEMRALWAKRKARHEAEKAASGIPDKRAAA